MVAWVRGDRSWCLYTHVGQMCYASFTIEDSSTVSARQARANQPQQAHTARASRAH